MNPRTDLTDWMHSLQKARSNRRFSREVRIADTAVRALSRYDTLRIFNSETLGRLIEWERAHVSEEEMDCQLVRLTRGERIVLMYLRSLARLPRRQYTYTRSKMDVPMEDLVGGDSGLESE